MQYCSLELQTYISRCIFVFLSLNQSQSPQGSVHPLLLFFVTLTTWLPSMLFLQSVQRNLDSGTENLLQLNFSKYTRYLTNLIIRDAFALQNNLSFEIMNFCFEFDIIWHTYITVIGSFQSSKRLNFSNLEIPLNSYIFAELSLITSSLQYLEELLNKHHVNISKHYHCFKSPINTLQHFSSKPPQEHSYMDPVVFTAIYLHYYLNVLQGSADYSYWYNPVDNGLILFGRTCRLYVSICSV